jgi:hypothetical protein
MARSWGWVVSACEWSRANAPDAYRTPLSGDEVAAVARPLVGVPKGHLVAANIGPSVGGLLSVDASPGQPVTVASGHSNDEAKTRSAMRVSEAGGRGRRTAGGRAVGSKRSKMGRCTTGGREAGCSPLGLYSRGTDLADAANGLWHAVSDRMRSSAPGRTRVRPASLRLIGVRVVRFDRFPTSLDVI